MGILKFQILTDQDMGLAKVINNLAEFCDGETGEMTMDDVCFRPEAAHYVENEKTEETLKSSNQS